jgi:5-methylcytosine-specific restriction endonuclease McrA
MTRKEAIKKGLKVYNGRPCKTCGSTEKYVSAYTCKPCNIKRSLPKLYDDELMAQYRTKEKLNRKQQNWRKNNPEKVAVQYGRRNSSIRPDNADLKKIQEIYKECYRKTKETGIPHEVDHIIPVSKGGLHHQDNLQILTREENRRKSNKI